jgi:leucyl aminopeptidase
MGGLAGVAAGSARPPRFVVLEYEGTPNRSAPRLAIVGKGITFDSGGLSLKTSEQMEHMKGDMAGAATMLAAMNAIAQLRLPVRVLGLAALAENMPGPAAMKLGDVLTARNGKTMEILNTDAEGRLVLSDALCYAVDQGASHIVDLATLTGSCVIALGAKVAGLMTNNAAWGDRVKAAAARVGERIWELPMFDDYAEQIQSGVADIKNIGGKYGGAITAAKFLENFVASVPWVHLDIAGPAWADKESATQDAGGTGVLVRTLVELSANYAGSPTG